MTTSPAPTADELLARLHITGQPDLATTDPATLAATLGPLLDDETAPLASIVETADDHTAGLLTLAIEIAAGWRRTWLSGPAARLDAAFTRDEQLLSALR